jgi:hypothetical protein
MAEIIPFFPVLKTQQTMLRFEWQWGLPTRQAGKRLPANNSYQTMTNWKGSEL